MALGFLFSAFGFGFFAFSFWFCGFQHAALGLGFSGFRFLPSRFSFFGCVFLFWAFGFFPRSSYSLSSFFRLSSPQSSLLGASPAHVSGVPPEMQGYLSQGRRNASEKRVYFACERSPLGGLRLGGLWAQATKPLSL